jgi:hypothetical protein
MAFAAIRVIQVLMATPKYRLYFREMLDEHEILFAQFKELHDKYQDNQDKWQEQFNTSGNPVLEIIRAQEARLCGGMERGNNAKYSAQLAEKFWGEVRAFFPMIDYVGVVWT